MPKPKMSEKPLFCRYLTQEQYDWVKDQSESRLLNMTAIIRDLIQEKIDLELAADEAKH